MEPGLNAAPPALLERIVRTLLPPAVREEVAGDLWERFRSPAQYLAEAAAALPFIIFSQMRRATNAPMFALQAYILFASFGGFEPAGRGEGVPMWQRVLVVTVPSLIMLLLRDAYRTTDRWTLGRAAADALAVVVAILASQAAVIALAAAGVIDPSWRMPVGWLFGGIVFSLMMLFIMRTGVELAATDPRLAASEPMVDQDYERFRQNVRFKNAVETGALSLIVAVALWFCSTARPLVAAIGFSWIALTLLMVAHNLTRGRVRPLSGDLGLTDKIAFYRGELVRQRGAIRFVWWWYFVPLFAGLGTNLIVPGLIAHQPAMMLGGIGCVALLGYVIGKVNKDRRRQIEDKIAVLDALPNFA